MKAYIAIGVCIYSLLGSLALGAEKLSQQLQEYVGCFNFDFESSFFIPIPTRNGERWHVTSAPDELFKTVDSFTPHAGTLYLKVIAEVGSRGRFGYMGSATRELTIHKIVELRQFEESDGVCIPPIPPPSRKIKSSANQALKRTPQSGAP
jgi:hypothetical protein